MIYTIVGILIIILDQAVKLYVTNSFAAGGETVKTLIPGVLSLVRVQNDGAAFSFLAGGGARIWFIVLTLIFVGLVVVALATNFISGKFGRWCMVIVAAGGLSNCIDRVLYGYVVDMFRIDLFDFAVFNVADIFITVGCIAFILYILFGGEKEPDPDADEFDEEDDESLDKPERKPLFKKKAPSFKKADDDDDEDEDDEEEEEVVVKKKKVREPDLVIKARAQAAAQKEAAGRKTAEEEAAAFEEFFKKRAAAKTGVAKTAAKKAVVSTAAAATAAKKTAPKTPVVEYDDEEFEPTPVKKEVPPAKKAAVKTPKTPITYDDSDEDIQVSAPAPEPKSKPAASSDDFDLDSILNEFK